MNDRARTPSSLLEEGAELDAAVAREVMRWASLGAHLWQDAYGAVYYTGHDPARVFVPHMVFRPSSDALHATWVEEQMRRLGTHAAYVDALIGELTPDQATLEAHHAGLAVHALLHAAPAQRCRAALQVVERGADA